MAATVGVVVAGDVGLGERLAVGAVVGVEGNATVAVAAAVGAARVADGVAGVLLVS